MERKFFIAILLLCVILLSLYAYFGESPDAEVVEARKTEEQPTEAVEAVQKVDKKSQAVITAERAEDKDLLYKKSLEEGFVPTQELGEQGFRHGRVVINDDHEPFVYPETRFERLPDSPLIKFTDEMVWKEGEDYVALQEALEDQRKTNSEASLALASSERYGRGKIVGFELVEIPPDTLFSKLGMQSGDMIVSINGGVPDTEASALWFIDIAAFTGEVDIGVERRGKLRMIKLKSRKTK